MGNKEIDNVRLNMIFYIIIFILILFGIGIAIGNSIGNSDNSVKSNNIKLVLAVIILAFSIAGICINRISCENFTIPMYNDWDIQLEKMKKNNEIGDPSGVLSFLPNQKVCPDLDKNLLVQNNVPFRPTPIGTGCTYIQKRYPD